MKKQFLCVMTVLAASTATFADGLNPGSALVYPVQYAGAALSAPSAPYGSILGGFTVVCITNTNLDPVDGATNVHFEYVNIVEQGGEAIHCNVTNRVEYLTPGDTLCVAVDCHNAVTLGAGYLVASAQNPAAFDEAWAFDHLVGSEIVIDFFGAMFTINAIPFSSPAEERSATDVDGDEQLDFDGVEYEGVPEDLYLDSFVAIINSSLILLNLTGGPKHRATVAFDIFNDNEFPLSATTSFQCWMQRCLADDVDTWVPPSPTALAIKSICISPVFGQTFLAVNTPDDPAELDLDCDGLNDLETGWVRIRGLDASSSAESLANPALLGATVSGALGSGGKRLWESKAKQLNGDFLNTGTVVVD